MNPRTEAPVLNARILKAVKHHGLKVAVVGPAMDLGYDYVHLGNSAKTLAEIADGTHPVCPRIVNAELPMLMTGSRCLERQDGKAIMAALSEISLNTGVLNEEKGWNGFNILHKDAARVGALDVGIGNNYNPDLKPKFVFIMGNIFFSGCKFSRRG